MALGEGEKDEEDGTDAEDIRGRMKTKMKGNPQKTRVVDEETKGGEDDTEDDLPRKLIEFENNANDVLVVVVVDAEGARQRRHPRNSSFPLLW